MHSHPQGKTDRVPNAHPHTAAVFGAHVDANKRADTNSLGITVSSAVTIANCRADSSANRRAYASADAISDTRADATY